MRIYKIITFFIIILLIGCSQTKFFGGFGKDSDLSFNKNIPQGFGKTDYVNWVREVKQFGTIYPGYDWLRKKGNLLTVHHTLKKIGYDKILNTTTYNDTIIDKRIGADFYNLTLNEIVDSLLITYDLGYSDSYFDNFWNRRRKEKNDSVCLLILTEIKSIYEKKIDIISFDSNQVNDTIEKLVSFDIYVQDNSHNITQEFAVEFYDYLKSIGLKQSAYNLLFLREPFASMEIDRDSILMDLRIRGKPYEINGYPYYLTKHESSWIWHFDLIKDIDRTIKK